MFHNLLCFLFGLTLIHWVQSGWAAQSTDEAVEESGCLPFEFACKNSTECIPSEWRCDRDFDCKDYSDEQHCEIKTCDADTQFQCLNSTRCIQVGWVCDGVDDCGDNSDEHGDECETLLETCSMNEYNCPGTSVCIPLDKLCDGDYDCAERVDEGSHCVLRESECSKFNCSQKCQYSIGGAICYCDAGYHLTDDNRTCSDFDECEMLRVPVCDQTCINQVAKNNTCDCTQGFILQPDNRTCLSQSSEMPILLVASSETIQVMQLGALSPNVSLEAHRANAVNYDFARKKIYWVDRTRDSGALRCVASDQLTNTQTITTAFDIKGVEQFAIEWATGNLYFVDSRVKRVFVCTVSGEQCLTIVDEGLSNPRGIALDPLARYFFVSDWGDNPKIVRYAMDGSAKNVTAKTKISLPQCLTADLFSQRIYWTDASMDHIQSIPYDGNQLLRYTVISGQDKMGHPYGIAVFDNYVYSTNSMDPFLIKRTKRFQVISDDTELISSSETQSAGIQVSHSSLQPPVNHECATQNGGCQHFCLIVNGTKEDYCRCSIGFKLNENGTCTRHILMDGFLIYGKGLPGAIKGISMSVEDKNDVIEPLIRMESPRGLDYDFKTNYLYYADSEAYKIVRRPLISDGSDTEELLSEYVNNCEGVAVDWISRNLYWTDDGLKKKKVPTATLR